MKKKKILFILNPISGLQHNKKSIEYLIRREFSGQSTIEYDIQYTEYAGHASVLSKKAADDGWFAVIAVGGDGTMNEVASGLVHSQTALGLIPKGSGNGYARSLHIPLKAQKAIETIKYGKIRTVDVGKINQYYFFGVTGMGFDAYIGAKFQDFGLRGPIPYFYIGVKGWFQYDYEAFTIKFDGQVLNLRPLLVSVANTPQYGMSAMIAPQAKIDDGILDLCILKKMSTLQALPRLPRLFNGTVEKVPYYEHHPVREVVIEREKDRGIFHTDGEPRMGGKILKISVLPAALKVIVPEGA